jgi:hypothetical protein
MSNDNDNKESSKNAVGGIIASLKENPKALYVAGGVIGVILIATMMGGGTDDGVIKTNNLAAVGVGQTVTVENPNIGDTWLTAAPKMGSEETGEEKDQLVCLVKAGASAKVDEETVVTYISYAKITVQDGECQGKTGWTPKVNVKAR